METIVENLIKLGVTVKDEKLLRAAMNGKIRRWLKNHPQDKDSDIYFVNSVGLEIMVFGCGEDTANLLISMMQDDSVRYVVYVNYATDFYDSFKDALEAYEALVVELIHNNEEDN